MTYALPLSAPVTVAMLVYRMVWFGVLAALMYLAF